MYYIYILYILYFTNIYIYILYNIIHIHIKLYMMYIINILYIFYIYIYYIHSIYNCLLRTASDPVLRFAHSSRAESRCSRIVQLEAGPKRRSATKLRPVLHRAETHMLNIMDYWIFT